LSDEWDGAKIQNIEAGWKILQQQEKNSRRHQWFVPPGKGARPVMVIGLYPESKNKTRKHISHTPDYFVHLANSLAVKNNVSLYFITVPLREIFKKVCKLSGM